TTDAMFARVEKWINRLPEEMADVPAWAMTLAHGKARLNPLYSAYVDAMDEARGETPRFDQRTMQAAEAVHDDGENDHDPATEGLSSVVAHEWFRGRKRRLLSTFGVGTIDQPLMAALEQKHLMVRHVALAGKVLIVDECHASDTYMNQYVDRMLHWLGNYRSPVILLSATLTHERKEAMIRAYAPDVDEVPQASGYPCLTWVDRSRSKAQTLAVEAKVDPREVFWDWIPDDDAAILQTLREELADGGCALVVRNTVRDAQRIATMIEEANIAPLVELTHSRFLASDRAAKDSNLVKVYGPGSGLGTRPEKSVVVGTQVVEQSLDVDFDVLITDLCPMDLLFQRIGRLHRHRWHQRPERLQQARVHVIGEPDEDGVLRGSGGSHRIYSDHHLLRTALLLQSHGSSLELPTDIAPLVQAALGSGSIEAPDSAWAVALSAAAEEFANSEAESATKAGCALLGEVSERPRATLGLKQWLKHADDFSELAAQAGVRDAQPSLEVIVALVDPEGLAAMSPPWDEDPVIIDTSSRLDDMTARRIATWTVKLPAWLTPGDRLEGLIKELSEQRKGWRWKDSPYLKNQPILVITQQQEGVMVFEGEIVGRSGPVKLRYTPARGLEEVTE
ncbi:MAG: CRISPR-associated helicase Cas3', partial [Propionibacteriaceae bacterium]